MPAIWGALIGGGFSLLNEQKRSKSNQASINAMSQIANRPQRTGLGSFFTPGGTSSLAPYIQNTRSDVFSGFPGYKSVLQDSTNQFLNNIGNTRNYLVGGGMGYNPVYQPPSSLFGSRPMGTAGAKPTIDQFTSTPSFSFQRRTPSSQYDSAFVADYNAGLGRLQNSLSRTDYEGYNNAVANWNQLSEQEKAEQAAYDQQVQEYLASQQQPGTPTGLATSISPNSDFINAATSPVREAAAQQGAFLQRDMGRRRISGSSIANNQMNNLRSIYGEKESRVKADAIQSALSQATGLDKDALNASTQFINNLGQLDQTQLSQLATIAQEQLAMMGLGQASVSGMMQPLMMAMQNNNQRYDSLGRAMGAAGWSLGQASGNPFATGYQPMSDPDFGPY